MRRNCIVGRLSRITTGGEAASESQAEFDASRVRVPSGRELGLFRSTSYGAVLTVLKESPNSWTSQLSKVRFSILL